MLALKRMVLMDLFIGKVITPKMKLDDVSTINPILVVTP